jgi:protocatechuate 3,4-dioxygenase beta subunit
MHALAREIRPTQEEWRFGVDFLTATGRMFDDKRQEFILLSDTLGISMLVDAINHGAPAGVTETTVLGPFYLDEPPEHPHGSDISPGIAGQRLFVSGTVRTPDGKPLAGAIVDVWHSDDDGYYDVQKATIKAAPLCGHGFAQMARGASISGPSSRPPIPFPMTARSARCSRPRGAIPCGLPMCIS